MQYNDNSGNPYSDVFWLAALVQSIGELEFGQQVFVTFANLRICLMNCLHFSLLLRFFCLFMFFSQVFNDRVKHKFGRSIFIFLLFILFYHIPRCFLNASYIGFQGRFLPKLAFLSLKTEITFLIIVNLLACCRALSIYHPFSSELIGSCNLTGALFSELLDRVG